MGDQDAAAKVLKGFGGSGVLEPVRPSKSGFGSTSLSTNDMRLFGLLHLLGQASLRMEQALWPGTITSG